MLPFVCSVSLLGATSLLEVYHLNSVTFHELKQPFLIVIWVFIFILNSFRMIHINAAERLEVGDKEMYL